MRIKLFIPIVLFFLLLFPSFSSADFEAGETGEGIQLYTESGYMGSTPFVLLIASELANNSEARGWEMSIAVIVNEDVSYYIQAIDSHADLKGEEANAIPYDEGKVVGTQSFGPWFVRSDDTSLYGDLYWHIYVRDLTGREIYLYVFMRWGEGLLAPPGINDGIDDEEIVAKYSTGNLIVIVMEVMITLTATLFFTYNKQKNKHIQPKDLFKEDAL